jgi:Na+-transporting methylmalonyl-CoA/oxaloacetate decarboxylase gamma subunit
MLSYILSITWIGEDNVVITLVGIGTVFLSLLTLFLVFNSLPKVLFWFINLGKKRQLNEELRNAKSKKPKVTGEENAAIAMALYLYLQEIHDDENTSLTINRISKSYSPWSSKIYNVFNLRKIRT